MSKTEVDVSLVAHKEGGGDNKKNVNTVGEADEDFTMIDSVTRGYKDLDYLDYCLCIFVLTALRCLAIHPLTLALTRKQGDPTKYASRSTYGIVTNVVQTEGGIWTGLGKGAFTMTAGCALTEVLYLGSFEYFRDKLTIESTTLKDTASGYGADAVSRVIQTPCLVIATRQMLDSGRGYNTVSTFRTLWKTGGTRALWAGFATILVGGCSWTGVWWGCYGLGKDGLYTGYRKFLGLPTGSFTPEEEALAIQRRFGNGKLTSWFDSQGAFSATDNVVLNSVVSCGTSGITAFMFNPYLVIRTRLQAQNGVTVQSVVRSVYKESGVRGFWHGAVLSINSCILDAWLASSVYEYAKLFSDKSKQ